MVCRLFGLVFCDYFFFGLDGRVDRVMGHIQKERLIFMFSNKVDCLVRFAVGQVFTGPAGTQRRYGPLSISIIGIKVAGRLTKITATDIEIESLPVGIPVIGAEVPFSDMT